MLNQPILPDLFNAISLPELGAGRSHSDKPVGQMINQSGLDHAHASLSAQQENKKTPLMQDTSRRHGSSSSASAALQLSLVSKLHQRLAKGGSTLYSMYWKTQATPAGRRLSRLVASEHRTSGKGSDLLLTGWVTPSSRDWKDTPGMATKAVNPDGSVRNRVDQLPRQAVMAGWPTPVAKDDNKTPEAHLLMKQRMGTRDGTGANRTAITSLHVMAKTAGPARLTTSGQMLTGSSAGMESGGQLNPELPRWLQGYPAEWGFCKGLAMQSISQRRKRS